MAFEKVNVGSSTRAVKADKQSADKGFTVSIDSRGEIMLNRNILKQGGMMALDGSGILPECALLFFEESTKKLKMIFEFVVPKNATNVVRVRTRYSDPEKKIVRCAIMSLRTFLKNYFFNMPKKAIELPCVIENQEILVIDLSTLNGNTTEHTFSVCEVFLIKKDDEYIMNGDGYKMFENYNAANKYLRKEVLKIEDIKDIDEIEEAEEEIVVKDAVDKEDDVVDNEEKELTKALKKGGIDLDKEVERLEKQIFGKVLDE